MVAPVPAPPAADPTAVFGRRVVAAILDTIILLVPGIMLVSSQFEYLELGSSTEASRFCESFMEGNNGACFNLNETVYFSEGIFGGAQLAGLALSFLILVVLQGLTGWTPGKLLLGLRTVREDGRPAGIGRAALRWVLLIVDGQPCGLPLVGFITGLTTKGHRRVGDMAAKTFVVRSSAAGSPIVVPGLTAPPPPTGYSAGGGWGSPPPSGSGAPAGWGPTVDPNAGWGAPGPSTAAPTTAAPTPQWDEARGTYIQWDQAENAWMQWDEQGQRWFKIQGQ